MQVSFFVLFWKEKARIHGIRARGRVEILCYEKSMLSVSKNENHCCWAAVKAFNA